MLADRALKDRAEIVGGLEEVHHETTVTLKTKPKLTINKLIPTGGKVYTIVDGGEPVESSGFWYPLIEVLISIMLVQINHKLK